MSFFFRDSCRHINVGSLDGGKDLSLHTIFLLVELIKRAAKTGCFHIRLWPEQE